MKLLVISFFLCFAAELSSTSAAIGGGTCFNDEYRLDCGYYGIQERECIARGCCWNPRDDVPWCFEAVPEGCVAEEGRQDCGYIGISEYECEVTRECCYVPSTEADIPWCFHNSNNILSPSCRAVQEREDCGYFGIDKKECQERDCCWDPKNDEPWCFKPAAKPTAAPAEPTAAPAEPTAAEPTTAEPTAAPVEKKASGLCEQQQQQKQHQKQHTAAAAVKMESYKKLRNSKLRELLHRARYGRQ